MRLKRIFDVAEKDQTDKLKLLIYRQIEKFVYKYAHRYYPSYKGDLKELALDIFEEFLRKKRHRNGQVFSELDRLDPSVVGNGHWTGDEEKAIATYTQRFVTHTLIDKSRTDKHEVSASENYDEKHGGLTLDRAARKGSDDEGSVDGAYVENINYQFYDLMDNPIAIKNARKTLVNDPDKVKYIRYLLKHYRDRLDPQVVEFITNLLGEEEEVIDTRTEVSDKIKEVLGDEVKVQHYSLQHKPAVKIAFEDKDAAKLASELRENLIKELAENGYRFYKAQGSNWYFFKEEEISDSLVTDARKSGGIDPRTGKLMSREEALNYDGPERKFVSFEAYKKENPIEGVDFVWVDQQGNELPDFHAVKDDTKILDAKETKAQKQYKEALNHFKDHNFYAALYAYLSYWFPFLQKQGESEVYPNPVTIDGIKVQLVPSGSRVRLKVGNYNIHQAAPTNALDFIAAFTQFDKESADENTIIPYSNSLYNQKQEIKNEGKDWEIPASLANYLSTRHEFKRGTAAIYSEGEFNLKLKQGEVNKDDYEKVQNFYVSKLKNKPNIYRLDSIEGVKSLISPKFLEQAFKADPEFEKYVIKAREMRDRNLNIVSYNGKVYYVDVRAQEPTLRFLNSRKQRSY